MKKPIKNELKILLIGTKQHMVENFVCRTIGVPYKLWLCQFRYMFCDSFATQVSKI
jgi:hypothetical protein